MNLFKTQYIALSLLILIFSFTTKKDIPITPQTALQRYLDNGDMSFKWELKESYDIGHNVTAYDLMLISQTWREHVWKHQLTVLVPEKIDNDGALLFITGGSIEKGEPNLSGHEDDMTQSMGIIAAKNKALVSIIRQTPNQPLYDGLGEDQLISYTFHNFKKDGDYTWPLLFPMVKTAVKAMDAVQEFAKKKSIADISRFVVSGASKRGWTTWLTGSQDPRVVAIAPMVIDVLNMPVSLDYQLEVWKEYSVQIEDYTKLGIPQSIHSEKGDALTAMVDPYSYRKNLTMPKMIFIGANDEYWPVDAIKNYIDSIPGQNFIHYVPNAGHGLGDKKEAIQALSSFFGTTINNTPYPICNWTISPNDSNIELRATSTSDKLVDAIVWTAASEDRDFRDEEWEGKSLNAKHKKNVKAAIDYPPSGYKAFYVDLKYVDPIGDEYTKSTRMFVTDANKVYIK